MKILANFFRVHLVSITDEEIPSLFKEWAQSLNISYKIFKKKKYEFYLNASKFIFNSLPIQINYFYFKDIKSYVDRIYKDFDILFPVLVRTAEYLIDKDKPKILDITDSMALNYFKSKDRVYSIRWKLIYTVEAQRMLNYEKKCLNHFDKVLFVNKEEAEYFSKPQKVVWIPNGVDERLFEYQRQHPSYNNYVVFFGKMNYQPNIDAVLWFVQKVLPHLDKNIKFAIVGAYPAKIIKSLERNYSNITVTGYVEEPYEILKSALCVVSPMQTGGGIQNKILESMALGTINIVSSLAAKPIGAVNGVDFLVIDDPVEMGSTINDIYKHPEKYEYLRKNSRNFIKNKFTWSIYEKRLLQVIEEVLNDSKSKGAA